MLSAKKTCDPIIDAKLDSIERKTWPAKYKKLVRTYTMYYPEDYNNCSVMALALALDISYGKAHAALSRAGRPVGEGCSMDTIIKAAAELGATIAPLVTESVTRPTLAYVRDNYAKYSPVMAVMKGDRNAGHVATISDGAIYDFNTGRKKAIALYGVLVPS
jgi:hypothetical protein